MRFLVTGAAGMLGRDVAAAERDCVALARDELDVTDAGAVSRAIAAAKPDVIVNCAAYTNVDGAETEREAADAVNVTGAANIAAAAGDALVVYPSSDYVFDGEASEPYAESSATHPVSAYGQSKLDGERATAAAARHLIVRTSWLYGHGGRNFVETMLGAAERGPLRVVDDQVGCPTYTVHLAAAIVTLARSGTTGVAHVAGGGECSWYEFAGEIFRAAGVDAELAPCTTAEFPRPARRPAYSVLRTERDDVPSLPSWQEGLSDYLAGRLQTL